MKTVIYYFSGTGNSLKIAQYVADALGESEIISIAKICNNNQILCDAERVGFIFPLYYFGLPKIVYDFVKKLDFKNNPYIFSIITRGGSLKGVASHDLKKILKMKTKRLDALFFVKMVANYVTMYNIVSEKKQIRKNEKALRSMDNILTTIKNGSKNNTRHKFYFFWKIANRYFYKTVNKKDKKFYSNDDCNSCGICKKICPVKNIQIINDKPQWLHNCQKCVACINFCPQKAIQYGKRTISRRRYHHPDLSVKAFIE